VIVTSPPYAEQTFTGEDTFGDYETYEKPIPQIVIDELGKHLKEQRLKKQLSKNEIDQQLGTNTAYSWWEGRQYKGQFVRQLMTPHYYRKLKKILEIDNKFDAWFLSTKIVPRKNLIPPHDSTRLHRTEYAPSEENIGNLKFDVAITSPPYEGSLEGGSRHTKGGIASRDPALAQTGTYATRLSFGVPVGYSPKKDNIGNLKKETYLEAMLQVYREMWKVLKPNGKAIIIIKPFIRNKKVVDLPYHTWLLLKKAGFTLTQLFKLRLKQQSFWRILYHKKFPSVPKIAHEYVLVTEK